MASRESLQRPNLPIFLTIPLELRNIIFKLLSYQVTDRNFRRSDLSVKSPRHFTGRVERTLRGNHAPDWPKRPRASLASIRAVNRQLYLETLGFHSYPGLSVRMWGSIKEENMISNATEAIRKYRFIQDNLVDIVFTIGCCNSETVYDCPRWVAKHRPPRPRPWVAITSGPNWIFRRPSVPKTPLTTFDGPDYGELVASLNECSRLEYVHIKMTHGEMFGWWKDARSAFSLLAPLLGRSVKIDIEVDPCYNRQRDTYCDLYGKIMNKLNRGAGEVVLRIYSAPGHRKIATLSLRDS